MIREEDLRELVSEDGCLYTSDVTKAGIRREELARFVDKGTLVREMRGVAVCIHLQTHGLMNSQ